VIYIIETIRNADKGRCSPPVIGITSGINGGVPFDYSLNGLYVSSLTDAGDCVPIILPAAQYKHIDLVDRIAKYYVDMTDGLVISGGGDLDTEYYGEENMVYNGNFSVARDAFEIALCKCAVDAGIPILGICRGAQIMNVAMGGSLYQDIIAQKPDKQPVAHDQKSPGAYPSHYINIFGGSLLDEILGGAGRIRVNSHHHQAVKDVAPGMRASATADDGIVEAIEIIMDDRQANCGHEPVNKSAPNRFILGIQWHPERMSEYHINARAIFKRFISFCRSF
jgi:putative glutamine amidotransferase